MSASGEEDLLSTKQELLPASGEEDLLSPEQEHKSASFETGQLSTKQGLKSASADEGDQLSHQQEMPVTGTSEDSTNLPAELLSSLPVGLNYVRGPRAAASSADGEGPLVNQPDAKHFVRPALISADMPTNKV